MKPWQLVVTICCLFCCAGIPAQAKDRRVAPSSRATVELIIRLREKTTTPHNLVRLGDCAEIYTDDESLKQQFESLTLFPAPPSGRQVNVDYDWLRARLNSHGVNLARVEFTGSPLVTVVGQEVDERPLTKTPAQKSVIQSVDHRVVEESLTHDDRDRAQQLVTELIRRKLLEHDPDWNAAEITVTLNDDDAAIANSAVRGTWKVHSASAAESTDSGFTQLWTLSCTNRAGIEQMVGVTAEILPPPQILRLKHNVPAGHVLRADDLEWTAASRRDVDLVNWREVVGKETVRPLRAAAPLTKKDVRPQVLVRHNDIVRVTVNVRGIHVSKEFKANSQGGMGETIPLTSLDGRQKISARVTALHEAEVVAEPRTSARTTAAARKQLERVSLPTELQHDGTESEVTHQGIRISINDARPQSELSAPLNSVVNAPPPALSRRWKRIPVKSAVSPVDRRDSLLDNEHDVRQ